MECQAAGNDGQRFTRDVQFNGTTKTLCVCVNTTICNIRLPPGKQAKHACKSADRKTEKCGLLRHLLCSFVCVRHPQEKEESGRKAGIQSDHPSLASCLSLSSTFLLAYRCPSVPDSCHRIKLQSSAKPHSTSTPIARIVHCYPSPFRPKWIVCDQSTG